MRISKVKSVGYSSIIVVICQLLGMIISFVMVPLTLKLLGVKIYGVWITLIGIIEWFNFFDIGFGHGLRNKYAEARARGDNDNISKYVSTTFFCLLGISAVIFLLFIIFGHYVSWTDILNAPSYLENELYKLAFILCLVFCFRFIFNIVFILLIADQQPYVQSIIILIGSILSFISLLILMKLNINSLYNIGLFISLSQIFPILISFIYFFSTKYINLIPKIKYFYMSTLKEIFSLGINFFLIQITALLLFQTNNIIIAHVCGIEEVTEYNLSYKYMNIVYMLFLAYLNPFWSYFTNAYARNDLHVIKNKILIINKVWLGAAAIGIFQVIASTLFFRLWVKNTILPNYILLILLLFYFLLTMRYTIYRTLMNGVGKIKLQFFVTVIEALLHIPLAILLGKKFGIYGVVGVMIIWSLINNIWEPIQYVKIIKKKDYGIWGK